MGNFAKKLGIVKIVGKNCGNFMIFGGKSALIHLVTLHISKKLNPALHHIQPFIELPPNPARAASWESGHFLAMLFSYLERFVSYFLSSLVSKLAQKCCILLLLLYRYCSACRHLMAKASHALTVYPRGPLLTALGIRKNSRLSIRPLKPTFHPT